MAEKTCCVTGHRDIPEDRIAYVEQELRREVLAAIQDGYTRFISGFAEGADLMFAAIVVEQKKHNPDLFLEAAIPYAGRLKTKNKQFHELLSLSKKPHCIVAKWLLVVGEDRKAEKVATCGGRVS